MPPATVEVGKLEIVNINLNKQFISLHKVITKHRHKTPQENLKAETTRTWIIPRLATLFEYWFIGRRHVTSFWSKREFTITIMAFDPTTLVFI